MANDEKPLSKSNADKDNPGGKSWTAKSRVDPTSREAQILNTLRSVSPLNKDLWIELAKIYVVSEPRRAEVAYVGARYADMVARSKTGMKADSDLMHEWLGVYAHNRPARELKEMIHSARIVTEGMLEVIQSNHRLKHELQWLMYCVECEDIVGDAADSIIIGPM